jgi:hypothetical protein
MYIQLRNDSPSHMGGIANHQTCGLVLLRNLAGRVRPSARIELSGVKWVVGQKSYESNEMIYIGAH